MSPHQTNQDRVNERLPLSQLLPLGLQHVLAMYAGAVIVPLIVGGALKLLPHQIGYLIAADLFTCGIATLLQAVGLGNHVGIRLPVVLGCSFIAVGPMITIGTQAGIGAIYGSIIAAGLMVFIFAPFFGRLLKFFPPVVTGSVVTIIGLSLIPVAINNAAGGHGSSDFGEPRNFLLAVFVLASIVLANRLFKGLWQTISVLLGILAGTLVAAALGLVNFDEVARADWVHVVRPFYFGTPHLVVSAVITMMLVSIVCMIESTGVFLGVGKICEVPVTQNDIVKGFRAEGLAQVLGGIFNSFPYTTFSQNMGLVALTGIRSRFVVIAAGLILVTLGLLPKFAALAVMIPNPVLGGAMIAMFGMVAVSGIKMLLSVDFDDGSNMIVVACSISIGLGVAVVPDLFSRMPSVLRIFLDSGIVMGSFVAVLLNACLNWRSSGPSVSTYGSAVSKSNPGTE